MDVLIVEDEPNLLFAIVDGLSTAIPYAKITGVGSVEEAESLLASEGAPRLVVSDIRLPGKSGIHLFLHLREASPSVKFILMSAFEVPSMSSQGHASQLLGFFRKPFELPVLEREVKRALKGGLFAGSVGALPLLDFLQVVNLMRDSVLVEAKSEETVGRIYLFGGEVVHAEVLGLTGVGAFNRLISENSDDYRTVLDCRPQKQTIGRPLEDLLIDATRRTDERA